MQLLMRRPETDGFISVSPPSNMYDFSFLAPCPASGLFLHGTADSIVPPVEVERVVNKLRTQKGIVIDYELEEGASHFWQDHMGAVETRVGAYLDSAWKKTRRKPPTLSSRKRRRRYPGRLAPFSHPSRKVRSAYPGEGRSLDWLSPGSALRAVRELGSVATSASGSSLRFGRDDKRRPKPARPNLTHRHVRL